mmetsp:Transcript_9867/g.22551  ORF Transcript_9867/g.22551 Transcript_9867/m.22551 type:complete len:214 (+) Transcript_9867:2385-3026(+)
MFHCLRAKMPACNPVWSTSARDRSFVWNFLVRPVQFEPNNQNTRQDPGLPTDHQHWTSLHRHPRRYLLSDSVTIPNNDSPPSLPQRRHSTDGSDRKSALCWTGTLYHLFLFQHLRLEEEAFDLTQKFSRQQQFEARFQTISGLRVCMLYTQIKGTTLVCSSSLPTTNKISSHSSSPLFFLIRFSRSLLLAAFKIESQLSDPPLGLCCSFLSPC